MGELARSDRRVSELCSLVAQRQSLVSYHLRQLRDEGIVSMRRSDSDARDAYYTLDSRRCDELLAKAGGALVPRWAGPARPASEQRPQPHRWSVLFLCTGNSARSQIAEALAGELSDGQIRAASAGSHPKPVHRNAVRVMAQRGIDLSGHRSKHLDEFADEEFDYVITLCDRVREVCPEFPGGPEAIHWSIADPGRQPGTDDETLPAFEAMADELAGRISFLIDAIEQTATKQEVTAGG
jgi:protein-tyrosine-phosphatase